MATFINLNLGEPTPKNYLKKHLVFSIIWLLDIAVLLFRIDTYLFNNSKVNSELIAVLVPFLLIVINFVFFIRQKWYYSLAFIFYPILIVFWFIPKIILEKGKVYLMLYYLESVIKRLANFKRSLIQSTLFILMIILLSTTDDRYIRILGICYFSYLFYRILYNYVIGSFKRGDDNLKPDGTKKVNSISKINLVENIEKQKDDDKLTPEQNLSKKIERMILWNYFLQYVSNNINSYRGKRAFMIVWFFQYFLYFFLTISFFTFLNYQIFKIDPLNFTFTNQPNLFDFFYYTIKTVSFSGTDSLKPLSSIARIIEICSFFILSIYFLIITISSIFSLKMAEYSKDMEVAVELCRLQNEKIKEHLQAKYNTDIAKAVSETERIGTATFKLKIILERIL